jgi:hypothetical protein
MVHGKQYQLEMEWAQPATSSKAFNVEALYNLPQGHASQNVINKRDPNHTVCVGTHRLGVQYSWFHFRPSIYAVWTNLPTLPDPTLLKA